MNPEQQQIVDTLLEHIHDKLADRYLRAQRVGHTADELVALVDTDGVNVILRADPDNARIASLLNGTAPEQRGMLPVVFPLNGKAAVVWLSVTALAEGGTA